MRAQPTGIDVLDQLLGGIAPGLPCVVSGASGSGRTVLALSAIGAALDAGRVVTLLCNEPAPFLIAQADSLGIDVRPPLERGQLALLEMDVDIGAAFTGLGAEALVRAISDEQPLTSLLVVDPFTVLTSGLFDEAQLRSSARAFVKAAQDWQVLLTVERERLSLQHGLERILAEVCGALLGLDQDEDGRRVLRLEKTRSGVAAREQVAFRIGSEGVTALPDRRPATATSPPAEAAEAPEPAATRAHPPAPDRREEATPPEEAAAGGVTASERPLAPGAAPAASAPPAPDAPARPRAPEPRERRVLLVDCDGRVTSRFEKWLGGHYEVEVARDGFEAMTSMLTARPDLVVLELLMPRVTGYELLAAMQRAGIEMPRLVISERIQRPGDRLGPLMLGATDVLAKPVEKFELLHKVDTLLRLQGTAAPPLSAPDAEALFASISKSRVVEREVFEDRLARVGRLGDRLGMPSSLTTVAAGSRASLDAFLETCEELLRFEDAFLRVSARRAVLLLVATDWEDAPPVVERLCTRFEEAGGHPQRLRFQTHAVRPLPADFDWHSLFRTGGGLDGEPDQDEGGDEGDAEETP